MNAAHSGILAMNLGLERVREDFINEINLGNVSSNDLISRTHLGSGWVLYTINRIDLLERQ